MQRSSTTDRGQPKRGEIWMVRFEPQVGREIMKVRPAVVISARSLEHLPLRIIVPIRELREIRTMHATFIPVEPTSGNGLKKDSMIDVAQVHSFDIQRFQRLLGHLDESILERVVIALHQAVGE
ncbi:MAG: type II toxin-antitoxin system PemK/MazF family toxin [Ignavibacteriae bacterium]|nr:MAG: type II toxin-antitoxin system PemK/MazF family toxin [Ignavibacteriota bacterium]